MPWIVPISGTTKVQRLEESLAAVGVALTTEDLDATKRARIEAQGERYSEVNQRWIDR